MEVEALSRPETSITAESAIKTEIPIKYENPEETGDQSDILSPYLELHKKTKVENEEEICNQFVDESDLLNSLVKSNAEKTEVSPGTLVNGDLLPASRETCILPHVDSKVERKPFIQNIQDVKPVKNEESCFQDLDSKRTLNFIPVIKLERNQEIERCISEVKKEAKMKCLTLDIKPKAELPIVPFIKVKKGLKKLSGTEQLDGNLEPDDSEDERNDFASAYSNDETENYALTEQEISNCTLFVCQKCNRCYRNGNLLENHSCSKICCSRNHICREDCAKTFPSGKTRRNRSCTKFKTKFTCSKCNRSYSSQRYLRIHLCGGSKFQCDYCQETFNTRKDVVMHSKIHNEKPYTCSECGKKFREKKDLVVHTRRHTDAFPFRCEECGKGFSQQAHLKCHMGKHNGEKPFNCDQCDKAFMRIDYLKQHKLAHTRVGDKLFKCSECGKGFVQNYSLTLHKKIHSDVKPFVCAVCKKCFNRAEHLKVHTRTHSGEKPYVCDHCGKGFSQSSALTVHKRVHSKVKPYECKECGAKFKHSSVILTHMRIHSKEKPFKCEKCGKRFSQNSNYHSHMRSMHEAIHIQCDICGKTCSQRSNLVAHLRRFHDDRLYTCGVCKKCIKSRYHFHKHVQLHISKQDIRRS